MSAQPKPAPTGASDAVSSSTSAKSAATPSSNATPSAAAENGVPAKNGPAASRPAISAGGATTGVISKPVGPPVKPTPPTAPRSSVAASVDSGTPKPSATSTAPAPMRVAVVARPSAAKTSASSTSATGAGGSGTTVVLGRPQATAAGGNAGNRTSGAGASAASSATRSTPSGSSGGSQIQEYTQPHATLMASKGDKTVVVAKGIARSTVAKDPAKPPPTAAAEGSQPTSTSASAVPADPVPLKANRASITGLKRKRLEADMQALALKVVLPASLKTLLLNDRTRIVTEHKSLKPPKQCNLPTLSTILQDFTQSAATQREKALSLYFVHGLKLMFHANCERSLLYHGERSLAILEGSVEVKRLLRRTTLDETHSVVDLYGGVHLLRLLIKLPSLVQQYNDYNRGGHMETPGHEFLQRKIDELLQYLATKSDQIFPKPEDYSLLQ